MIATPDQSPIHHVVASAGATLLRNAQIAEKLGEAAELLAAQSADPFRVAAYRRAAETLQRLDRDVADIEAEGGRDALDAIPSVGPSIAGAIAELLHTGRWRFLDRLRATTGPAELFETIPGIGPRLARRLHDVVGVDTLEALETATHDGRLETVQGIGRRRVASIRNALSEMLGRVRPRLPGRHREPEIGLLLDVDREYCEKAASDALPKIAPKRFNPTHEAWLPVLHTRRDPWEVTALYSNTARAHELGRVKDWVVMYFHVAGQIEMQRTVVTERRGPLDGKRVVRGREAECRQHYGVAP
jgi:predicted flap endonuclease-1-like 5' DNA nuclease